MEVTQRAATKSDIGYLMALRRDAMDEHLRSSGSSTGEDEHLARLMYGFEHAQVLEVKGVAIGLLKLVKQSPAWELIQIQLEQQYRGSGLGAKLLRQVIEGAASAGCEVKLSVLKSNPAKRLYERFGFKVIGEDKYEYQMYRTAAQQQPQE